MRGIICALSLATYLLAGLAEAAVIVTPNPLAYTGQVGTGALAKTITIRNTGTTAVSFAWADDVTWMSGNPVDILAGGAVKTYTLSAVRTGLAAGIYSGTAKLWSSGVPVASVQLSLTLGAVATPIQGKVGPVTVTMMDVADPVILKWTANTEVDLKGYKVYVGLASRVYGPPSDIPLPHAPTAMISNVLTHTTYYFAVTAYDNAGNESPYSAEAIKVIP